MSKYPRSKGITDEKLFELAEKLKSPFWAYDADIIRSGVNHLRKFDVIRYAQKACSNVNILKFMKSLGTNVDSVSLRNAEITNSKTSSGSNVISPVWLPGFYVVSCSVIFFLYLL